MRFYRLTHPKYDTDWDALHANPIQIEERYWMPGLVCPACGTWSGHRRIPIAVEGFAVVGVPQDAPLPMEAWRSLENDVKAANGALREIHLRPGDLFGQPIALVKAEPVPDFMHPFSGQLVVREQVLAALRSANLTGYTPIVLDTRWCTEDGVHADFPPKLYMLVVTGIAWRQGIGEQDILACEKCGRRIYPYPDWQQVDETRWDGSDFFNVDRNPGMVFVTEHVCSVLAEGGYTNYVCMPFP